MRLILIYPPRGESQADAEWYPLGIASLAANCHITKDIICLDLINHDLSDALSETRKYLKPDDLNVIGITIMTDQRALSFKMIKALKGTFFNEFKIKIIAGGPHPSIMHEQIEKNYPEIDYIVVGEGEGALNYILDEFPADTIVEADPIKSLSDLQPAIKGMKYFIPEPTLKEAPITFSRGCDGYCTFCATNKVWKGYRSRKAVEVYTEIMEFKQRYKVEYFKVQDDSASSDMVQLATLCGLLKNKGIEFEITTRIDRLDRTLLELLAAAGCKQIAVGIESGNQALRCAMGKNLDMAMVKENTKIAQSLGINVHFLLIIGYPGETAETIEDTCKMLADIRPSSFSKLPGLMVIPGAPIYNKFKRDGFINDSYWLSDLPCPIYTGEYSLDELKKFEIRLNNCMNHYKILIAGVVNQEERVFKEYLKNIENLELDYNIEVEKFFILHNSPHLTKYLKTNEYIEVHNKLTHDKSHKWTGEKLQFLAQKKNEIVALALKTDITHIFWIDSDLMVPKDLLVHLVYKQAPIIAAAFWTQWPGFKEPMPNAWDYNFYDFCNGNPATWKTKGDFMAGGVGACILVNIGVYKSGVNYNPVYNISFSQWEDRAFCIRAGVHGFPIVLNTEKEIKHLYSEEQVNKYFDIMEVNSGVE